MVLNEALMESFALFLSRVPARRLKQNALRVLIAYRQYERAEGLPDYSDDFLTDLIALFDLLDAIDREVDQSHII